MPPRLLRRGPSVKLDVEGADDDAPKWIQVAYSGAWNGHAAGPFEFTRETFESFVANFQAHPSYKAGPDGIGCADVLPFDFSHASEMPASSGDIPIVGTPAQAWAQELEIREGEDGKLQLWALTRYLEPARTYVREGKYKWTSVSAWFDGADTVTGEPCGPCLTSIAFTNNPFLQGMVPIVASRNAASSPTKRRLSAVQDAFTWLRSILGYPDTASSDDVRAKLAEVKVWATSGNPPTGVDVDDIVSRIKSALSLPVTTSSEATFAEADKLFDLLEAEGNQPVSAPVAASAAASRPPTKDTNMDLKVILSQRLKLKADSDETAILLAVNRCLEEGEAAVGQASTATDALASILGALSAGSADEALAKIAQLQTDSAALADIKPQIDALKQQAEATEAAEMEQDVEQALASYGMPATAKQALLSLRKSNKDMFGTLYPKKQADPAAQHASLTQSPFATNVTQAPSGPQVSVSPNGSMRLSAPTSAPAPAPAGAGIGGVVNLAGYVGRNITEKAMAFVRTLPEAQSMTFDQVHERASTLIRTRRVVEIIG